MLAWLGPKQWKKYIEETSNLGTYISHFSLNEGKYERPKDTMSFSDEMIQVNIKQKDGTLISIVYNCCGPIDIFETETESPMMFDEYALLTDYPIMIAESVNFVQMMSRRLGNMYIKRRIKHCQEELSTITEDCYNLEAQLYLMQDALENIDENDRIYNKSKSNHKKIDNLQDEIASVVDTTKKKRLEKAIFNTQTELKYIEEYISYQQTMIQLLLELQKTIKKPEIVVYGGQYNKNEK